MLRDGWAKVLPGQFGPGVDPIYLTQQVGQLTPSNLLWTFMGASRGYTIFAGIVETTGGVLLLTRRTATLGALISAAAMSNVLMLNLAYDVNVKKVFRADPCDGRFRSCAYINRLADAVIFNRPTAAQRFRPLLLDPKWDRGARIAGLVISTGLGVLDVSGVRQDRACFRRGSKHADVRATWEVQQTLPTTAGAQAATGPEGWRYLVFPRDTDRHSSFSRPSPLSGIRQDLMRRQGPSR